MKPSALAVLIRNLADKNGIAPHHVRQLPAADLEAAGLDLDDLTPEVITEAENWHRHEIRRINRLYNIQYTS